MVRNARLKQRVRQRMARTGERYTEALRNMAEPQPDRERCGFKIEHVPHFEGIERNEMFCISKDGRRDWFTPDQMAVLDEQDDATFESTAATALGLVWRKPGGD